MPPVGKLKMIENERMGEEGPCAKGEVQGGECNLFPVRCGGRKEVMDPFGPLSLGADSGVCHT